MLACGKKNGTVSTIAAPPGDTRNQTSWYDHLAMPLKLNNCDRTSHNEGPEVVKLIELAKAGILKVSPPKCRSESLRPASPKPLKLYHAGFTARAQVLQGTLKLNPMSGLDTLAAHCKTIAIQAQHESKSNTYSPSTPCMQILLSSTPLCASGRHHTWIPFALCDASKHGKKYLW